MDAEQAEAESASILLLHTFKRTLPNMQLQTAVITGNAQLCSSFHSLSGDHIPYHARVTKAGAGFTAPVSCNSVCYLFASARNVNTGEPADDVTIKLGGKSFDLSMGPLIWIQGHVERPIESDISDVMIELDGDDAFVSVVIGINAPSDAAIGAAADAHSDDAGE